jgi:hypothetical protein
MGVKVWNNVSGIGYRKVPRCRRASLSAVDCLREAIG